jgi:hypothetical protein
VGLTHSRSPGDAFSASTSSSPSLPCERRSPLSPTASSHCPVPLSVYCRLPSLLASSPSPSSSTVLSQFSHFHSTSTPNKSGVRRLFSPALRPQRRRGRGGRAQQSKEEEKTATSRTTSVSLHPFSSFSPLSFSFFLSLSSESGAAPRGRRSREVPKNRRLGVETILKKPFPSLSLLSLVCSFPPSSPNYPRSLPPSPALLLLPRQHALLHRRPRARRFLLGRSWLAVSSSLPFEAVLHKGRQNELGRRRRRSRWTRRTVAAIFGAADCVDNFPPAILFRLTDLNLLVPQYRPSRTHFRPYSSLR